VYQYAEQARQIDHMFKALCEDAGLLPEYNEFSECNTNQICVVMNVLTPDASATEDNVVEAVSNEVENGDHDGLVIGHVGDFTTG
jgi:hypothetical protein